MAFGNDGGAGCGCDQGRGFGSGIAAIVVIIMPRSYFEWHLPLLVQGEGLSCEFQPFCYH